VRVYTGKRKDDNDKGIEFHKPFPSSSPGMNEIKEKENFLNSTLLFFVLLSHLRRKEAWSLSVTVFTQIGREISPGAFVRKGALWKVWKMWLLKCRGIFINFPSIVFVFSSVFLWKGFLIFLLLLVGRWRKLMEK
jgi:hypothetical protein